MWSFQGRLRGEVVKTAGSTGDEVDEDKEGDMGEFVVFAEMSYGHGLGF